MSVGPSPPESIMATLAVGADAFASSALEKCHEPQTRTSDLLRGCVMAAHIEAPLSRLWPLRWHPASNVYRTTLALLSMRETSLVRECVEHRRRGGPNSERQVRAAAARAVVERLVRDRELNAMPTVRAVCRNGDYVRHALRIHIRLPA